MQAGASPPLSRRLAYKLLHTGIWTVGRDMMRQNRATCIASVLARWQVDHQANAGPAKPYPKARANYCKVLSRAGQARQVSIYPLTGFAFRGFFSWHHEGLCHQHVRTGASAEWLSHGQWRGPTSAARSSSQKTVAYHRPPRWTARVQTCSGPATICKVVCADWPFTFSWARFCHLTKHDKQFLNTSFWEAMLDSPPSAGGNAPPRPTKRLECVPVYLTHSATERKTIFDFQCQLAVPAYPCNRFWLVVELRRSCCLHMSDVCSWGSPKHDEE